MAPVAGAVSSSETMQQKMEEEMSEACWRKEVDINLKRLQSLVFGAGQALEMHHFSSAQILTLALIGFLDSRSNTDVDEVFIRPIRCEALSNLDAARHKLMSESDRQAFEQAGRDPGHIFTDREIGIDKIKRSKYFHALLQISEGIAHHKTNDAHTRQENLSSKISKSPVLASYGDGSRFKHKTYDKDNSSNIHFIEKIHLNHNSLDHGVALGIEDEEVEIPVGRSLKMKQLHMENFGQRNKNVKSPLCNEGTDTYSSQRGFVTARSKLEMDVRQTRGLNGSPSFSECPQNISTVSNKSYGVKPYGNPRRGIRGNFVSPIRGSGSNGGGGNITSCNARKGEDALEDSTRRCLEMLCGSDGELPEKLKNLEPRLIEHVSNEIMDRDPNVRWNDIAGLEHAKKVVNEMVIYPLMRPDLFSGCRSPGRGLLLFGPPGTGKTMIGKAIAGEAKATFFYISASSLTSKWIGEGEKLVRALFGVASCLKPAVIFVDEIDSLLSQRKSEGEHESSRRLKTQFLIEMEGFDSGSEQILLIGATNRPQELDEAARRRLTKRLYIPLPSSEARSWIIQNLLEKDGLFSLSKEEIEIVCRLTEGYSGSDMKNLVKDASMGPVREVLQQGVEITKLRKEDIRTVSLQDFENSLQEVRPSVSLNELGVYETWNKQFGSLSL